MTGTSAMNGDANSATTAIVTMAAQHDGSRRAAVNPSRSEGSRLVRVPLGGLNRTNASATTTARNDTAFATNAIEYPNAATVIPASAGPPMRPRFHSAEFSEAAARNSRFGTRSGKMAC
jgi:hypothetical protein